MGGLSKAQILEGIRDALRAELEGFARSARAAQAEATDEQCKAENKYDTRGLEASYLARGQSRQAMEMAAALQQFGAVTDEAFAPGSAVDLGALVEIESPGERALYFMGPCAGGTQILHAGQEIMVLSPASPLGRLVMGQKAGHRFQMDGRKGTMTIRSLA